MKFEEVTEEEFQRRMNRLKELQEGELEFDIKELKGKKYIVKINDPNDTSLNILKSLCKNKEDEKEHYKIVGEI